MLMPISRVITAVVVCWSSVGGSPIIPTRSVPPLREACGLAGPTAVSVRAARTASDPSSLQIRRMRRVLLRTALRMLDSWLLLAVLYDHRYLRVTRDRV